MRLFKNEVEKARETLKVSSNPLTLIKSAGWRLILLLAVGLLAELILVPLVTALVCFAKNNFAGLGSSMSGYLQNHLLDGWSFITCFNQWQTPAMLFSLVVIALIVVGLTSIYANRFVSNNIENIFGPAACDNNQKGSARLFADELLLKDINNTWEGEWNNPPKSPGIVMGYSKTLKCFYLTPPETHHMIIGTPGSGKTTKYLYSSLGALCASGASCIITDPKGEIYNATSDALAAHGIDVYVLDFDTPDRSMCFNPLDIIYKTYATYLEKSQKWLSEAAYIFESSGPKSVELATERRNWESEESFEEYSNAIRRAELAKTDAWAKASEYAADLAEAIIPDMPRDPGTHWNAVSRGLLRSMILLVGTYNGEEDFVPKSDREKAFRVPEVYERTLESIREVLSIYGGNAETGKSNRELNEIMDRINPEHPAVKAYAQTRNSIDKEAGITVSNCIKFLDQVLNGDITKVLNKSDFNLASFGTKQGVLYIILPDEKPARGKLFTVLATQLYQALVSEAKALGKKLPVPVYFLLEELGNIKTPIPNLGNTLAMSRGYNIFYTLILQGFNQLPQWYGETVFRQLLDTCSVKMLLQTEDAQVCGKYFSDSMGNYTYINRRVTHNRKTLGLIDNSASSSQETGERPLMKPDEITKWNCDWGTIVLQSKPGKKPGWIAKHIYKYKHMQPCAYPIVAVWDTPLGRALDIGDEDYERAKAQRKQLESRLGNRQASKPWLPVTISASEEIKRKKDAQKGAITSAMTELLESYLQVQDIRVKALEAVLSDLNIEALKRGKEEYIERYVDAFIKSNLMKHFEKVDPENRDPRGRNRQKASVTNLLFVFLGELLMENEEITQQVFAYRELEQDEERHLAVQQMLRSLGFSVKEMAVKTEQKSENLLEPEQDAVLDELANEMMRPVDVEAGELATPEKSIFKCESTQERNQREVKNKSIEAVRAAVKTAREKASSVDEYLDALSGLKITVQVGSQGFKYKSPGYKNYISEQVIGKTAMRENLDAYFAKKASEGLDSESVEGSDSELSEGLEGAVLVPEIEDGKVVLPYGLNERKFSELCAQRLGQVTSYPEIKEQMLKKNLNFVDLYLIDKSFLFENQKGKPSINTKILLDVLKNHFDISM